MMFDESENLCLYLLYCYDALYIWHVGKIIGFFLVIIIDIGDLSVYNNFNIYLWLC